MLLEWNKQAHTRKHTHTHIDSDCTVALLISDTQQNGPNWLKMCMKNPEELCQINENVVWATVTVAAMVTEQLYKNALEMKIMVESIQ